MVESLLSGCGTGCTARTYSTATNPAYGDSLLNDALAGWKQQVVQRLPGGSGTVTVTKDAMSPYHSAWIEVTVKWKQKKH